MKQLIAIALLTQTVALTAQQHIYTVNTTDAPTTTIVIPEDKKPAFEQFCLGTITSNGTAGLLAALGYLAGISASFWADKNLMPQHLFKIAYGLSSVYGIAHLLFDNDGNQAKWAGWTIGAGVPAVFMFTAHTFFQSLIK